MRFSFKKTLASILSVALMLTTVLGALTASAEVEYAGTLTLEDAQVTSSTEEFDVEAVLSLNQATTFLALAFQLDDLPEGVTLSSASIGSLGEAAVNSDKRLVLFDIGDISVSLVPITLTFTASGIAESFTISVVNYECADVSEEFLAIDITDTAEVQLEVEPPVGPVEDPSLASTLTNLQLLVTDKVGFYFTFFFNGVDCDDFDLVLKKDELVNYTATGNKVTRTIRKSDDAVDKAYEAYDLFYVSYTDIALYEMGLDVEFTLTLYKDGVATKYYTFPAKSLSTLANEYYNTNANDPVTKSFAVDLLNMGTAAQIHFAATGPEGNTLSTLPLPNANVDQSAATDYGILTEVEGRRDDEITTLLKVGASPSFWYTFFAGDYKNPADLTFTATYYSKANGKNFTRSVNGADLTEEERGFAPYGLYYFGFEQVALYDADKVVTLTIAATDGTTWVHEYSVESLLSTAVNDTGTRGDVYRAVASFSASTHNMWPDY